jgi:predicted transcriptional regulator of viral defense system
MPIGKTNSYILTWIEQLQSRGKIAFSYDEVIADFPEKSENAIIQSLSRLSQRGRLVSIYKGFYLIIPPEYYAREILPPILFIDYLMEFIAKPYYVGLLSAAELYGAAHQQPQEFFIITTKKQFATQKKGIKINYVIKKVIPVKFLDKRKTETGYVKVSSPELTAFDLVYYSNRIGGISRTCTVLNELAESIDTGKIGPDLVQLFSVATIQRLGYIFDSVLNEGRLAKKLWKASQDLNLKFFRQPLNTNKKSSGYITDPRWKIVINTEIDIDE